MSKFSIKIKRPTKGDKTFGTTTHTANLGLVNSSWVRDNLTGTYKHDMNVSFGASVAAYFGVSLQVSFGVREK